LGIALLFLKAALYQLRNWRTNMIDQELTVELVCEMYEEKILALKKEIDRLNEEIQILNIQLKQQIKSDN
jgi:uncharacterized small protein (DUF1192 family)